MEGNPPSPPAHRGGGGQAVKRIAAGLALVGAVILILYLLFLFGWVR